MNLSPATAYPQREQLLCHPHLIALILARDASLSQAVLSDSALLALRHFGKAMVAPLFGWITDHLGAPRVIVIAAALTMLGFIGVAVGSTVAGALVMLLIISGCPPKRPLIEGAADYSPVMAGCVSISDVINSLSVQTVQLCRS